MINNALIEARKAPGVLEKREDGKTVLVRTAMIDYYGGICEMVEGALAEIPEILKRYGLAEYDGEPLQRAILKDGFQAVERAVYDATLARLKKTNFFPGMQEELARKNVESIPGAGAARESLEKVINEIRTACEDIEFPRIDLGALVFESGRLKIPASYFESVRAVYTLEISLNHTETVKKIREAAALMADLEALGIQVKDQMRIPPRGGNPILAPGLITRIVGGAQYSDAELIGAILGVQLNH